jgi:hypothetical protein
VTRLSILLVCCLCYSAAHGFPAPKPREPVSKSEVLDQDPRDAIQPGMTFEMVDQLLPKQTVWTSQGGGKERMWVDSKYYVASGVFVSFDVNGRVDAVKKRPPHPEFFSKAGH